jgi:hypothetical protein
MPRASALRVVRCGAGMVRDEKAGWIYRLSYQIGAGNPRRSGGDCCCAGESGKRVRNWFISLRFLYTQRTFWARYPKSGVRTIAMY